MDFLSKLKRKTTALLVSDQVRGKDGTKAARKKNAPERKKKLRRKTKLMNYVESAKYELILSFLAIISSITVALLINGFAKNNLIDLSENGEENPEEKISQGTLTALYITYTVINFIYTADWFFRFWLYGKLAANQVSFVIDTFCTWGSGHSIFLVYLFDNGIFKDPMAAFIFSLSVFRLVHFAQATEYMGRTVFAKDIRILWRGLTGSMSTLLFSSLTILLMLFMFSVVGCATIGHTNRSEWTNHDSFLFAEKFDNLTSSFIVLLQFLFADNAFEIIDALAKEIPYITLTFSYTFLILSHFCLQNMIVAIIVDNALQVTSRDLEFTAETRRHELERLVERLTYIFDMLDTKRSGAITYDEFMYAFDVKMFRVMLEALELDKIDLYDLFVVLDSDYAGDVDIDKFIVGMSRLYDPPRVKDFLSMIKLCETSHKIASEFGKKRNFKPGLLYPESDQVRNEFNEINEALGHYIEVVNHLRSNLQTISREYARKQGLVYKEVEVQRGKTGGGGQKGANKGANKGDSPTKKTRASTRGTPGQGNRRASQRSTHSP